MSEPQTAIICPACGAADATFQHRSSRLRLSTARCRICGLRFIRERLDPVEQAALYDNADNYRAFAEAERSLPEVRGRRKAWADELAAMVQPVRFAAREGRRPRLLDVGCGTGDFLVEARETGFEVHGLELSAPAAALAWQEHHIEISVADIAVDRRDGYFDAVTLIGVIEHVSDPAEFLRHAARLLAPGGVLLIYTPVWGTYDRVGSALARVTKGKWSRPIDRRISGAHLQIFSKEGLMRAARGIGLRVEESLTLCEYNLPLHHYLGSVGITSASVQRTIGLALGALIERGLFFRNNQRLLASKPR